jgi:hypothetical protein
MFMRRQGLASGMAFAAAVAVGLLFSVASQAAALHSPLAVIGNGGLDSAAPGDAAAGGPEFRAEPLSDNPLPASTVTPPKSGPTPIARSVPGNVLGAPGLNHHDSRTADGGNQFSLEPPDQALCVGNGFVLEGVNDAVSIRDAATNMAIGGVSSLNRFFGLASSFNRSLPPGANRFGPFTSDPKCLYDVDTRRFFFTTLVLATDPATNAYTGQSFVLIAVSKTSDPTMGFTVFGIDTTNDGSNGITHPGCPCLGDQPLIGLDHNGLYISTNEFPLFANGFNGAQIYGLSKQMLAAYASGASVALPTLAYLEAGNLATPDAGGIWYTVQPAKSTPNEDDLEYESDSRGLRGVEYFLSALDFFGPGDTRLALWALSNTASLQTATPDLRVQIKTIDTKTFYMTPDNLNQKGSAGQIQSNDDRMNQVIKYGNTLYGALNTAVSGSSGTSTAGVAYWGIKPRWKNGVLDGSVRLQGTVSVAGNNLVFPSIGLNRDGEGMMVFSLIGPDYYPSAAYVRFNSDAGPRGPVVVAGAGVAPYVSFNTVPGKSAGRWGDYSAAADDRNNVWGAAEFVPVATFGAASQGGLANWGTYVWRLTP